MLEPPFKDCLGREKALTLWLSILQEGQLEYTKAGKMRKQLAFRPEDKGTCCTKNTLVIHMLPVQGQVPCLV